MNRKKQVPRNLNQIAELLDVGPWRIRYILQSRRHIKPIMTLPTMRLFNESAVEQIKFELEAIEQKRKASVPA